MKVCTGCKILKPLSEYYQDRAAGLKDGRKSRCKDCCRAYSRARYYIVPPPDPERKRKILRAFRERNPGKDREYGRKWRQKDPDRALELARARGEKWRRTKPERKIASQMRRRVRERAVTQTDEDYIAVLRGDPCSYCGSDGGVVDHIEPLFHGGDADWTNLTAACRRCNTSKHTDGLLRFMQRAA